MNEVMRNEYKLNGFSKLKHDHPFYECHHPKDINQKTSSYHQSIYSSQFLRNDNQKMTLESYGAMEKCMLKYWNGISDVISQYTILEH